MIDTNKLLDGLKEIYDVHDNIDRFYMEILWNIAKGNWDVNIPTESHKTCYDCTYIINANGNIYCPIRGYIKDIVASECKYFKDKKECRNCIHFDVDKYPNRYCEYYSLNNNQINKCNSWERRDLC